ncbi:hypothetical protein HB162lentus_22270 [Mammaliicoccus lentus]|uniref:hypothetical protein n=1 Tax=unclassified Mammaliicoccus TaxID=2803851 RepID=UPI001EFA874E|nr:MULTISPECIES: hypothetical protein [unclassified Mammaliicoccus]
MGNIIKTIGKGIGKGIGAAAYVSVTTIGAAVSAIWETTGDRGMVRDALKDCSNEELMEIYGIQKEDDGDYTMYLAAKSLLEERGYMYLDETNEWIKR